VRIVIELPRSQASGDVPASVIELMRHRFEFQIKGCFFPQRGDLASAQRVFQIPDALFHRPIVSKAGESGERGFADVWEVAWVVWEYKGTKKNLDESHRHLLYFRAAQAKGRIPTNYHFQFMFCKRTIQYCIRRDFGRQSILRICRYASTIPS
jgi:hypothetical protein